MPNGFDATQIPAAHVPLVTKDVTSREWYRFFYNLFVLTGGGSNTASLLDLQLGPIGNSSDAQVAQSRYGVFSDTTTQTAAAINTAYAITFNTTDLTKGVYVGSPTSRIYVDRHGVYNFQFSLQLQSTAGGTKNVYIWAAINGVAVPNSATKITLTGGASSAEVAAWNFVLNMNADDYFELTWSTDNVNMEILAAAPAAPAPAIPSAILTVTDNIGAP